MTDIPDRLLNPVVLLTLAASGLGLSRLLWTLNLRPTPVLAMTAVAPGAIFLATIWAIRALQYGPSLTWPVLMIDWLVFSLTAVGAVLIARRRHP